MILKKIANQALKFIAASPYRLIDRLYVPLDRKCVRRTRNIRLIPRANNRRGGKYSYAEWAHVIGIFQTLMYLHLDSEEDNLVLDVGCGTGLLGIASEPFLGDKGRYVGIDVMKRDIDFCLNHYPLPRFSFIHFDVNNPAYTPTQKGGKQKWNLSENNFDLLTALSVWTHLNEDDAKFYFGEVNRVLKPGGKAIITFFLLDEMYEKSLSVRTSKNGRFHMTRQDQWIFDQPAYGSNAWFCPKWAEVPESAMGLTNEGLDRLIAQTDLKTTAYYPGNWKELPGVFFQDVIVFEKA
jgi:SAM-dependent methyltransferase